MQQSGEAGARHRDISSGRGPIVLVVDDEDVIVEVLALVLSSEGYDVHTQSSGAGAVEWLRGHDCDLVLLDFMMPGMDGGAVGDAVRALPGGARVAIVMSSALPERRVRERFPGYDAFLQKPYEMEHLLMVVERLTALQGRNGTNGLDRPEAPPNGGRP